jgi:methionyl-tRNA formyltransferase
MRVVFMGTPSASVPSLRVLQGVFDVAAVYTRADKPSGRGRRVAPSAVKRAAEDLGLTVVQPKTLRAGAETARLRELEPDAIAVVAYGMILPPDVLAVPRLGCVNVHFSLLPRWRGAAPVERAVMAGDAETGVTTMLMDEGLDTGPILLREATPIGADDTTGTITERLAERGAELLVVTLRGLDARTLAPVAQPADGVTIAAKIDPGEAELDFALPAAELERRVRALDPQPGAYTTIDGRRVKVWGVRVVGGEGRPGAVAAASDDGIDVQTPRGRLRLTVVQPEGKRRMTAAEFLRGRAVPVGAWLGR